MFVYSKYKEACSERGFRLAGKSSFYQLWQDVLPHISVSTPSTDLCFVCQRNNLAIQQSSCFSDEAKAERLATAQEHLSLTHKEREYYKSQVKVAVNQCTRKPG